MDCILTGVASLSEGALTEAALVEHVFPLFSRVLRRDAHELYLSNHSLGRPPDRMAEDVASAVGAWYSGMDGAWGPWFDELTGFRCKTAQLTGAPRPDCIVPKSSAGQGLRAVLNSFPEPPRVLTTTAEFDSIELILQQYAARGRAVVEQVAPRADGQVHTEDLIARLRGMDLVVVSHVFFATGQVLSGLAELIHAAHAAGAKVLLDCYHSYGALPLDLSGLGADFAVGGSYKYLRGGPGCSWLYVHPRWLDRGLSTLDVGWFAKKEPFGYERAMTPELAAGGDGWLESTFAPLPLFQARAGLDFVLAMGVERLRTYSLTQKQLLSGLLTERGIAHFGAGAEHGAFVTIPHPDPMRLAERMKRAGVNADARHAGLRLCPDVLTTEAQLAEAVERLTRVLMPPVRQAPLHSSNAAICS
jgi:kynureninase